MLEWISGLRLDLRFAARVFGKRPAFTAVAVIALALGIGATTAVLSIVDAVLLRPLPYKNPSRLPVVWISSAREKALAPLFDTQADYLEFRAHARSFENLGAATRARVASPVFTGHGPARQILAIPATASFFETLGGSAARGRTFLPEDETRGCSLLLAHSFWKSLGADTVITGKSLTLDWKPCTVLDVMPERFSFYPAPPRPGCSSAPPRHRARTGW